MLKSIKFAIIALSAIYMEGASPSIAALREEGKQLKDYRFTHEEIDDILAKERQNKLAREKSQALNQGSNQSKSDFGLGGVICIVILFYILKSVFGSRNRVSSNNKRSRSKALCGVCGGRRTNYRQCPDCSGRGTAILGHACVHCNGNKYRNVTCSSC